MEIAYIYTEKSLQNHTDIYDNSPKSADALMLLSWPLNELEGRKTQPKSVTLIFFFRAWLQKRNKHISLQATRCDLSLNSCRSGASSVGSPMCNFWPELIAQHEIMCQKCSIFKYLGWTGIFNYTLFLSVLWVLCVCLWVCVYKTQKSRILSKGSTA